MALTSLNDALDFAIGREKDAVAFYRELQDIAKFASQKELLEEFEAMEKGHVTLLQGVKFNQEPERLSKPVPEDLHLDDFLVTTPPTAEMTYQDILLAAIAREKKSASLYSRLKADTGDAKLQEVFGRLVVEEENHKHFFEVLYDRDIQSAN